MASSYSMFMAVILAIFVSITNDSVDCSLMEDAYESCKEEMKLYCNDAPYMITLRDCAIGGILKYKTNENISEHISQYFENIIYPVVQNTVKNVLPPFDYCHSQEMLSDKGLIRFYMEIELTQKTAYSSLDNFYSQNVLTNPNQNDEYKSMQTICLEYLENFKNDYLNYAIFATNLNSNPDNAFEQKYLRHISKDITLRNIQEAYAAVSEELADKSPVQYCFKHSLQFQDK